YRIRCKVENIWRYSIDEYFLQYYFRLSDQQSGLARSHTFVLDPFCPIATVNVATNKWSNAWPRSATSPSVQSTARSPARFTTRYSPRSAANENSRTA